MTQKISRKDLSVLYSKVCDSWKQTIDGIIEEQKFNDEIEAPQELIKKGYGEADASQKTLIERYFVLPKSIISRIKTFDDILMISGKSYEEILPWKDPKTKEQKSQNAFAKIQLISEVYNEGEILNWGNHSQYKWYPWFEKKALVGWVFDCSYCCDGGAAMGSGCYFKSKELSDDAAKKFPEIYIDYLPL